MHVSDDRNENMKKAIIAAALALALALPASRVHAAGTPAGTVIPNQATVNYSIGALSFSQNSSPVSVTVAELLDMVLTWQDAAPVTVSPGQIGSVTAFRITNTGNGNDHYTLAFDDQVGGDDFNPTVTAIYLDADANGIFESGTDTLYSGNTGTIARDASRTIFVLSTIPATGLSSGDTGRVQLTAATTAGAGPAGTLLPAQGDGGVDAIIGATGGTSSAASVYRVRSATVSLLKSAVVSDPYGGTRPQTGATIHYTIQATVSGTGTAQGVVITDPLPANTTYRTGSLALNGVVLTDGADGDSGDAGGTIAGTVTVTLGDMTSGTPAQTITFEVTIN